MAPLDDVWALKTDPDQLTAEFRPYFSFVIGASLPTLLNGPWPAEYNASLRPLGLPPGIPWPGKLEAVEPKVSFTDSSSNSLFSLYEHVHQFETTPDGCRYIDAVTFTPRLPAQKYMAILTQRLFQHRHRVAAKRLPTDPQATAVAMLRVKGPEE